MAELPVVFIFAFCAACFFGMIELAQAQNVTDPAEARVLNSIFQQWGQNASSGQWNISGELCSGKALDSNTIENFNPFIKCDCSQSSDNNQSTCHITELRVYALDVKGVIPEDLWTLTFLTNLNLAQNYLTGNLSASIGNLTRMQYLGFGSNNFSGSLPSELGNLVKLEQIYFDSSGLSGEIPSTFAKLQNLQIEVSRRISDVSNGSASLAFIKDMKSLTVLVLRNNNISDSIPSNIGEYQSLTQLDLSFNNITGQIPDSLFNLSSLTYLDLSYNNLVGSLPSWVSQQNLQLNLVVNNFTIDSSNSGALPSGLNCLQRSFPCNRGSGILLCLLVSTVFNGAFLAIEALEYITSSSGIVYESDSETLGPATYYVTNTNRWAVSNVGYFTGSNNPQYTTTSARQFTTLDSELFQTARISASSLRYYGLGLENGNYTVNLQFIETVIENPPSWRSLGRRVFDIYIQITSSSGIVYESDSETLGPATYYVTNTNRWAVSNVGYFTGSNNPQYTTTSARQFTTLDSELFQTARISASSLRYYGLGLENGNYTVNLQFIETVIENPPSWRSLGRRVFDIYIQGNRVSKDFDIRKEAGGVSYQPVLKEYNEIRVSENYLEIHLFWAGKGTCCIPTQGTYGPSISAISATPDFEPTVSNKPPSGKKNRTGLIVGIVVGAGVLSFLSLLVVFYIVQRRKQLPTKEDEGKPTIILHTSNRCQTLFSCGLSISQKETDITAI
ncbi:hypothetical protein CJ030_MR4G016063 [Morella rubra]|uniref:non-specific serine/threonine protein kinase n=1 Tax=Morella rubra TaxID=262757 RepID=A0A6A1VVD5_9ROSI|nr:hypothetical protein CJ030_MR4G016063 [Morella rubra]